MAEILTSIGPALANHLWQSTLFALLAAGLALLLRRNHARARYWIWMAASLKFLLPLALLMDMGSHLVRPRAAAVVQPNVYVAIEDVSEPFAEMQRTGNRDQGTGGAIAAPVNRTQLVATTCGVVWMCGFAAVLAVWCVRWRRVAAELREAVSLRDGRELEALRWIERAAGVRKEIRLVLSPAAMEPGVFGIMRPVLAWPAGISARLDDAQLEAILAHEIGHVRRRDNLTAAIHMFVEAIFWFHPLVWWLGARLLEERERACDEEVLLLCAHPEVYAESILKVCEFCVESPLACVSGVTGADLKKRILDIMTERVVYKLSLGRKLLLGFVGLGTVAVPIVLGQVKAAQRMMLAITQVSDARPGAPSYLGSIRAAAHTMIAEIETPSTGWIAEAPVDAAAIVPAAATAKAPDGSEYVPTMTFDVASVRENKEADLRRGITMSGQFTPHTTNLRLVNWRIESILSAAYGIDEWQVVGAPKWPFPTVFVIEAKGDADADAKMAALPADQQRMEQQHMFQALLADRFKLRAHWETKEGDVYNLVAAKGGPKLGVEGSMPPSAEEVKNFGDHPVQPLYQKNDGRAMDWIGHGCPMGDLASILTAMFGRSVSDETGLTGKYDFVLKYKGRTDQDRSADDMDPTPPLDRALTEELGLKVEAAKGPVKVLVIDHVEKPASVDGADLAAPASLKAVALVQEKPAQSSEAKPAPVQTAPLITEAGIATPEAAAAIPIKFDIVSFKACKEGFGSGTVVLPLDGDLIAYKCQPVYRLLYFAFGGPHPFTLTGEPAWVDTDRYDFQAKVAPEDIAAWQKMNLAAKRVMMQGLLEDVLKVKLHADMTPHPVYDLVVAKGGPKFRLYQDGESNKLPNGKMLTGRDYLWMPDGTVTYQGVKMGDIAEGLAVRVGRQVVDRTGLKGLYDMTLFLPLEHYDASRADAGDSPIPHIFDGVKALGLELQPSKGPTYGLVLDHIERPPGN